MAANKGEHSGWRIQNQIVSERAVIEEFEKGAPEIDATTERIDPQSLSLNLGLAEAGAIIALLRAGVDTAKFIWKATRSLREKTPVKVVTPTQTVTVLADAQTTEKDIQDQLGKNFGG